MNLSRETEADLSRERRVERPTPRSFEPDALPRGARLDEFEIVRVLGAGGFGIVYLALDQQLQRQVAIKEFIPTALAGRTANGAVAVRSPEATETFAIGLESFYNEGRLLARFDHPSLVRVFRFWKANGTAYMAMQYYPGQTLKEARAAMSGPPEEAWLRSFVDRLLGALATLHAEGVYHRDIAPDNILLMPDGQPVILDFGSARRVISDRTQSLTAILKPNYSPVEQYADDAGMRQGAYTDLYALGGTVYFMITGRDPIPAVMRAVRDSFPVLARMPDAPFATLSSDFLAVVDWTLGVAPDDRPQTAAEVCAALRGEIVPPEPRERSGVLIGAPGEVYDPRRAMAKTQVATRRAAVVPVPAVALGRARKLLLPGATLGACAVLFWALWGTPRFLSAEAQPTSAAASASAASPAPPASAASPVYSAPSAFASIVDVNKAVEPAAGPSNSTTTAASVPAPSALSPQPPTGMRSASARPAVPMSATEAPLRAAASTAAPEVTARAPAVARSAQLAPAPASFGRQVAAVPDDTNPASCNALNVFASAACLRSRCAMPAWTSHPKCLEASRIVEQRQRRMDQ